MKIITPEKRTTKPLKNIKISQSSLFRELFYFAKFFYFQIQINTVY